MGADEEARVQQREREAEERRQEQERIQKEKGEREAADKEKLEAWMKKKKITDINSKKSLGFFSGSAFPLHMAVKEKHSEMVRILLNGKADPSVVNSSGLSPLQFAEKLAAKERSGSFDSLMSALKRPWFWKLGLSMSVTRGHVLLSRVLWLQYMCPCAIFVVALLPASTFEFTCLTLVVLRRNPEGEVGRISSGTSDATPVLCARVLRYWGHSERTLR